MKKETYIRTDLAAESGAPVKEGIPTLHGDGFTWESKEIFDGVLRSRLDITSPEGEAQFGREIGQYITFSFEQIWLISDETFRALVSAIAAQLRSMLNRLAPAYTKVLIVGLGNRDMTPDAIGPLAVRDIQVTRHIRDSHPDLFAQLSDCEVSALTPGVVGHTGIETAELIRGAVRHVRPDAVIVIDALAARDACRLARTVQISDTGLSPGSGIGNTREGLNAQSLGVPVIALGVPTVVSSATLVCDALEQAGISDISPELEKVLKSGMQFFVSLKEADIATCELSRLLAHAVNKTFGHSPE